MDTHVILEQSLQWAPQVIHPSIDLTQSQSYRLVSPDTSQVSESAHESDCARVFLAEPLITQAVSGEQTTPSRQFSAIKSHRMCEVVEMILALFSAEERHASPHLPHPVSIVALSLAHGVMWLM